MTDADPDRQVSTNIQYPERPHGIAHGAPERAAVSFDDSDPSEVEERVASCRGQGDRVQYDDGSGGSIWGVSVDPSDEEWDGNEYRHDLGGSDDSPNATYATGLGKRQFKLQQGLDVAAPDEEGEWRETNDGDTPTIEETRIRGNLEAAMQQADVPTTVQDRVKACLDSEETGKAWSWYGGWPAAACGVLASLGYRGHAEVIYGDRDLRGSVDGLAEHAEERGLV